LASAGQNNRRIWVDLYQTKVDAEVVAALAAHIAAIHCKTYKRCFVGCPPAARGGLRCAIVQNLQGLELPLQAFTAPKRSKTMARGTSGLTPRPTGGRANKTACPRLGRRQSGQTKRAKTGVPVFALFDRKFGRKKIR